MAKRDCYEVLGLSKSASLDEIKKAYRKLALQFHPDRNPGDKGAEEKFREATEAYTILSDSEGRAKYDQFGYAAFEQGAGGFSGFHADFSEFEDIFGDLFSTFFGGSFGSGGRRTRGRAGRDLRYDLQITFEEAAFGAEKKISIQRRVTCEECAGSGAAAGDKGAETCTQCRGAGQVAMQQGFFTITRPCNVCGGAGKVIKNPCKVCSGSGLKPVETQLSVKIPAGIDNGQRLKLRAEGETGMRGGTAGDLYVHVSVAPHDFFERQESEIICNMPISYTIAVLGGEIDVPTLEGEMKLKIPAGTPSGKVFRLKNRGIQVIGTNRRGDQHVRVEVHVPKKVSDSKRALLEQIKDIEREEAKNDARGFFEKVKDIFAG